MDSPSTIGLVASAMFLGQLVKGATGFGGALTALPLLGMCLLPGPAMLLVAATDIPAGGWLAWNARALVDRRLLLAILPALLIGQYLGTQLLQVLPLDVLRSLLAVLVLLFGLSLLIRPVKEGSGEHDVLPERATPIILEGNALSWTAGLLGGTLGTPGPPLVWFLRRHFSDATTRAHLLTVFFPSSVALTIMLTAQGVVGASDWSRVAWAFFPALLGGYIGKGLSDRATPEVMGRAVGVILVMAGLGLLPT